MLSNVFISFSESDFLVRFS